MLFYNCLQTSLSLSLCSSARRVDLLAARHHHNIRRQSPTDDVRASRVSRRRRRPPLRSRSGPATRTRERLAPAGRPTPPWRRSSASWGQWPGGCGRMMSGPSWRPSGNTLQWSSTAAVCGPSPPSPPSSHYPLSSRHPTSSFYETDSTLLMPFVMPATRAQKT